MNKKIVVILVVLAILIFGSGSYFLINNLNKKNMDNSNTQNIEENNSSTNISQNNEESNFIENEGANKVQQENSNSNDTSNFNNSVVVYFSATGNTETVAKYIGEITNSPIIEIEPAEEYTSEDLSYNNNDCRANKEQNDSSARPKIKNQIEISEYETIYLGYPIWWGDVPKIILTFLDTNNLDGKTIIPFCTSGSSSISTSVNTLKRYNSNMQVLDGKRFSSQVSKSEISIWFNEIIK